MVWWSRFEDNLDTATRTVAKTGSTFSPFPPKPVPPLPHPKLPRSRQPEGGRGGGRKEEGEEEEGAALTFDHVLIDDGGDDMVRVMAFPAVARISVTSLSGEEVSNGHRAGAKGQL